MSARIDVEMGNTSDEECDDISDSQLHEYKELSYKLFQFRTHRLRCSNGGFGCSFCDYREENQNRHIHLLLHAIRAAEEGSQSGKKRANHFAMAKYLAIDLVHEIKAEAERVSRNEDGEKRKRPRLDEDTSKGEMDNADRVLQLERELEEMKDVMNSAISRERQSNDELRGRNELIKRLLKEVNSLIKYFEEEWSQQFHDALDKAMNDGLRNLEANGKLDEVVRSIIETVKESLEMKTDEEDEETRRREEAYKNLMKEKEDLERAFRNLLAREAKSCAELEGVRKELIKVFEDRQIHNSSEIGIKQMGEIDLNVFKRVCSKRFQASEAETAAVALCSAWQEKLKNILWHPFETVEDDDGKLQILVKEDKSLRRLKRIWGDEIYSAVVAALKDLYEYCPARDHTVAELWNFKKNRKAELKEAIRCVTTTTRSAITKNKEAIKT